jgi:TIR domain
MAMTAAERMNLVSAIGRELQSRYTFNDLRSFLRHHGIDAPAELANGSKWVYSKTILEAVPPEKIITIARELDLVLPAGSGSLGLPRNWQNVSHFHLFVSHISEHKDKATRLKSCLHPYAIDAFVAHEDIHPTLEWQREIERALHVMDGFLAIHTPGFSQSCWTQQEIGFAVARGVKIISLKMGEDPTGFISKQQALSRRNRKAEEIAEEIDAILLADPTTREKIIAAKKSRGLLQAEGTDIPF